MLIIPEKLASQLVSIEDAIDAVGAAFAAPDRIQSCASRLAMPTPYSA
jgi:hypothetical protein